MLNATQDDKFSRLISGNWKSDYPSKQEADLDYCRVYSWTYPNINEKALDRWFRFSPLFDPSWDLEVEPGRTYGQKTIETIIEETKITPKEKAENKILVEVGLNLTDMGNAERLVHHFGADIRYCPSRRRWLIWKNTHWQWDDRNEIEKLAKLTVRSIFQEAVTARDDKIKDIGKHAVHSENAARISAMIDLAQSETGVAILPNELDIDSWLLNCANGTLDLRTGELKAPTREDLITRKIETPYDPDAMCPLWMRFLETVMAGNIGLIQFLQRACGYSLTGQTREQVLFFLHGRGANGKTTFIETLTGLLGAFSKHTRPETFMLKSADASANNDLAELEGCRMVAAVELEEGRRLAEVLTKQTTGGDTLKARYLFQEYFEFRAQFKLWLCGNHKPRIQGTDLAIWRRIRLIPWAVTIPENQQDKELLEKLKNEYPGILTWAVKGCLDWQAQGLVTPMEVKAATAEYRREMDILGDFFDACIEVDSSTITTVKALYEAYIAYCEVNGEPFKERIGKKKFNNRVTERGFDLFSGTGNVTTWMGLKLKK